MAFRLRLPWRRKAQVTSSVADNRGGWWPWIREPFSGAWQRNIEWSVDTVLAHHAVYGCITLISNDIGKLRPKLVEQDPNGIWSEVRAQSPYWSALRKPNRYQNHIQFKEAWITSKLIRGNTYVLKERDNRGVVARLYILDPSRVTVLVAPDGSVFYQLGDDNLNGLQGSQVAVPASEIIHDRMNCLFHPLVGVSPIFAGGMAANVGLKIERNAAGFFENGSSPGGVLTAPAQISDAVAKRLKEYWETEFSGANSGKIAVLGDGLKFEGMRMNAVDSQMIEHLKWSAETVCSTFHVPAFKAGIGQMPTYQNGEILELAYYKNCLQSLIEQFELCMDEGFGIGEGVTIEGRPIGVELELKGLLRMDTVSQVDAMSKGVRGGVFTPNEGRRELDLPPLEGGDTIYLQHQDYPMEKVFARTDLNAPPAPTAPPEPEPEKALDFARARKAFNDQLRMAA